MLPVRGLWPGFGQGSTLGLIRFSGPVVPAYLLNDLLYIKNMGTFPPVSLMTWVTIK